MLRLLVEFANQWFSMCSFWFSDSVRPMTLTSYMRRQSSRFAVATGSAPNAPPAFATSTSTREPA